MINFSSYASFRPIPEGFELPYKFTTKTDKEVMRYRYDRLTNFSAEFLIRPQYYRTSPM